MAPDPNRIRAVFLIASGEHDGDARIALLDRECGVDSVLRRRVDALLLAWFYRDPVFVTSAKSPDSAGVPDAVKSGLNVPQSAATKDYDQVRATATFVPEASLSSAANDYDQGRITATFGDAPIRPERPAAVGAGTIIAGRYTLVEVIGEGGMGSVYLASQTEPVKRQVAIKLIKTGMDTKAVLARFDAERQALAVMDHPNIARIYDGGVTAGGQPYFVMELVRGVPITAYCDRNRLPVDARLLLFVAVCRAVQHAHQKGIIHRDLKPGNVLVTEVDGRPAPKVIDFGVAKATELNLTEMSFSDAGAIVGTPAYMSPEQADPTSMDIDTRTDVYALGVVLYELLVGSPPIDTKQFKRGAVLEMLRIVREVEPPRPSTKLSKSDALPHIAANRSIDPAKLSKLLQGELDWVVMKALEKDRTRRYETAFGFAEDIQRYLADELVEARPRNTGYRLKKFLRRNKGRVAVLTAAVLLLVVALAVMAALAVEAERARRDALAARELEKRERERAERNFATSRILLLDLSGRIEALETGLPNKSQSDLARKAALDRARELFDKFRADQPDDRQLQRQAAALHRYAANVSRLLSDTAAAEKAYASSIGIWEQLVESDRGDFDDRDNLAQSLSDFGTFLKRSGRLKAATTALERAAKLAGETNGHIPESAYRRTLGKILLDRADVEFRRGEFGAAEESSREAGGLLERLKDAPMAEKNPVDPLLLVIARLARAMALRELGRDGEALGLNDDAVTRMEAMGGARGSRDIRHFANRAKLERASMWSKSADKRNAAVTELNDVLESAEKLAAEYPNSPAYREVQVGIWLLRAELTPADAKSVGGDLAKALAETNVLLRDHVNQPDHIGLRARTYLLLGRLAVSEKKSPEAVKNLDLAKTVYQYAVEYDPDNLRYRRGLEEASKELAAAKEMP